MGVAWSAGVVAAKLDWLPALSRMPVALAASATLKVPTAVLAAAAAPSLRVRVAVAPVVVTLARLPPLGTL